MNIQPITYQQPKNPPNFKSAFPVVHWVAEANGSFAPVANLELTRKLQGKLVRVLNKTLSKTNKPMNPNEQRIRAYMGRCDIDYRNTPVVRSFYNRIRGGFDKFTPVSYMITGKDVDCFEQYLAKNIGKAKNQAMEFFDTPYSPKVIEAVELYNNKGLQFVKRDSLQIKDTNNMPYGLHTKFEIIRNKLGKIKDFRLLDVRFLPAEGKNNPLNRI